MLGKYDAVALYEAPSEKDAMKAAMERVELMIWRPLLQYLGKK